MTEISRPGPGMENARRVVGWMMGVPVVIGMGIVGWNLLGLGGVRGRAVLGYESGLGRKAGGGGLGLGEMKGIFGTGGGGGCKGGGE